MKKSTKSLFTIIVVCITVCLVCSVGVWYAGNRVYYVSTPKAQAVLNNFQLSAVDATKMSGETTAYTTLDNTENQGETTESKTDKTEENENTMQIGTAGKIGLVVGIVVLAFVPLISHIIKIKVMKKKK